MEGYMTIKQAAEKWDITTRRIQFLCSNGRIEGATKFGRDWAIPADAAKPEDKRVTTGEYRNWRKKKSFRSIKITFLIADRLFPLVPDFFPL